MTDPKPPAQLDPRSVKAYGFLRLQAYRPASRDGLLAESVITHDIAGDASLPAALDAVREFLSAAGYSIDGPLVVEEEP